MRRSALRRKPRSRALRTAAEQAWRACEQCGAEFEAKRDGSRFCSQACMGASYRKSRICVVCGTEFWFSGAPTRKTCSVACTNALKKNHRAREGGLIPEQVKVCARPGCQMPLTGQASKYCSPRCHYDDRSHAGKRQQAYHRCHGCGEVFAWNGRGRGIFCSRQCKDANAGPTALEPEVVEIVRLRGHRRADFRDDSETCRACGAPAAHIHHVIYRQHIERLKGDRWHPDDALALCVACHGIAHAHRLPVSVLRPENLAFAVDLLGAYAADHLRRYYVDDGDPRLVAMDRAIGEAA